MSKTAKLSPVMQTAMHILAAYGRIDRGLGVKSATIVALMDRGIIREAGRSSGHMHFAATTPEQVWDDALAEDARREAEQTAGLEHWGQSVDDEGREVHTRVTRTGATLLLIKQGYRYWHAIVDGSLKYSAAGDFAEVRRAADRFEREAAHVEYVAEREIAEQEALQATPAYQHFAAAVRKAKSYRGALDLLHAEALEMDRDRSLAILIGNERRRLMAGGFRKVDAMAFNNVMRGLHAEAAEEHERRTQMLDAAGMVPKTPVTPAEARTGISDRAAAALADVAALRRELEPHLPFGATMRTIGDRLDRIEAALRGAR
jgi:hypothetical protein